MLVIRWQLVYKEPLDMHYSVLVEVTVHLCRLPSGGRPWGELWLLLIVAMRSITLWLETLIGVELKLAVKQSITKFTTT